MGSHRSRAERENYLPHYAVCPSFDAAQDTVGPLGHKCTLLACINLFIHQNPEVLLHRAALSEFSQSAHISGIALIQMQQLVLGLLVPH